MACASFVSYSVKSELDGLAWLQVGMAGRFCTTRVPLVRDYCRLVKLDLSPEGAYGDLRYPAELP